jgi:ribose/xylose/arabinose/galactoside ABC-type transport system permease subunit
MSLFDAVKKKKKKEIKVRQSDQRRIDVSRFLSPYRQKILINIFALLIISGTIALLTDRFLTVKNITNVLRNVAPVIIVGSAFTPLMVSRMFDLSVGSVLALTGAVAALMALSLPLPLAFLIGILTGTLVGVLNATLTIPFGINSVIATLGTLYIARGSAQLLTGGVAVYGVPEAYQNFGGGAALGFSNMILAMVIVVAIFIFLERFTLLGRYTVAVGSNPEASFLSGIRGRRIQALMYIVTDTMAGFAGVLLSSRLRSGQVVIGVGFEFDVIVATVLGGTSIAGGEGTVAGMVIGGLIVGVLENGLNLLGVPAFWQTVAKGIVLVFAVSIDLILRQRLAERTRKVEMAHREQESGTGG